MFSKLLKYEWKANAKLLGWLTLGAVGVGAIGTVMLRLLVNHAGQLVEAYPEMLLLVIAMTMSVCFSFVALAIYAAAVEFILLYQFYKKKFTDEGYLTFTLPVSSHQIFLSSFVNILIWTTIATVVVIVVMVLALLIGTGTDGLINMELVQAMQISGDALSMIYGDWNGGLSMGLGILSTIATVLFSVISYMACIVVGAVLAKKHKILAAIGLSYGLSMVVGILQSVLSFIPLFFSVAVDSVEAFYDWNLILQTLLYGGLAVGGYFLSTHLMKNKLNLP